MVNVAGGTFDSGSDVLAAFPKSSVEVPSFRISANEVTVRDYQRVMGSLPSRMELRLGQTIDPDQPVTNVEYVDACEFAERVGLRLPTLDEFLFASTNRGTTKFPWGDSGEMIESWAIDVPQAPAFDVTRDPPGIHGLYSRVAEWTESGIPPTDLNIPELPTGSGTAFPRMIAACMPELLLGRPNVTDMRQSCRLFVSEQITPTYSDGLGFRCAISDKPRLVRIRTQDMPSRTEDNN
jgi:formylglycine-generating enzyme required for sulfatase activity